MNYLIFLAIYCPIVAAIAIILDRRAKKAEIKPQDEPEAFEADDDTIQILCDVLRQNKRHSDRVAVLGLSAIIDKLRRGEEVPAGVVDIALQRIRAGELRAGVKVDGAW